MNSFKDNKVITEVNGTDLIVFTHWLYTSVKSWSVVLLYCDLKETIVISIE